MSKTDYGKLEKSIARLKEQHKNWGSDRKNLAKIDQEAIEESVIKRFEICYDTLLKHLKKFMEEQLGILEIKDYPAEIFRKAKENGIVDTETQKRLNDYRKIRNLAAHSCGKEEAQRALSVIESFIEDVSEIYQTMVGWQ